jgi:GTP-binding protein EngB required for normal cell division
MSHGETTAAASATYQRCLSSFISSMTAFTPAPDWEAAADQLACARRIASELRREDLVARIDAELRSSAIPRPLTIVVVGETSRGKSGLINALLSMPDLLPVDSDVATGVYVLIGHGDSPQLRLYTRGSPGPLHGEIDELADWASVSRNPENCKGVMHIEAEVPAELLREGVRFADTPGVGGLDSAHGIMTLTALEGADAMLFVADALAPLSEPELEFLQSASQRIQTVIFALTKADLNPFGWEDVVAENRELLKAAAPRFANHHFFCVRPPDATRALHKRKLGDEQAARRLDERSGVERLTAHLRRAVIDRAESVRVANAIRLALSVLEQCQADCRARRATLNGDPQPLAELQAAQDELAALAQNSEGWLPRVRQDFEDLSRMIRRDFTDRADAWRRGFDTGLEQARKVDKERDFPAEIEASVQQIAVEVDRKLKEGVLALAAGQAARLGIDDFPSPEASFALPERERIAARGTDSSQPHKSLVVGALVLGQTASVVRSLVLSAGSPLALIMAPLSLGTAVTSVYAMRQQGTQAKKAEARWLLKEYDDRFRRDVSYALDDALRAAREETEAGLRRTIDERRITVEQRIQNLTLASRDEGLAAARAQVDDWLDQLGRHRAACRAHLQTLSDPSKTGSQAARLRAASTAA